MMEPKIIGEAVEDLAKKKVVVTHLTQDGDSSTMAEIIRRNVYRHLPWATNPIKVGCWLHATRNCGSKIRRIVRANTASLRDLAGLDQKVVKGIRTVIKIFNARWEAAENDVEKARMVDEMSTALLNVPWHYLGNHSNCGQWCREHGSVRNATDVSERQREEITRAMAALVAEAPTLIMKRSINRNESANAVVNGFSGQKRVHYSNTNSCRLRFYVGVIQYNTKTVASELIWRLYGGEPNQFIIRLEAARIKKLTANSNRTPRERRRYYVTSQAAGAGYGEGVDATVNPLPISVSQQLQTQIVAEMSSRHEQRTAIEAETIGGPSNENFRRIMSKGHLLSADNFGYIVCTAARKVYRNKLRTILYSKGNDTPRAIQLRALHEFKARHGEDDVLECGLCIHPHVKYLMANPVATWNQQTIVVKYHVCSRRGSPPPSIEDAIARKISGISNHLAVVGGQVCLKTRSQWYNDVQGHLACTGLNTGVLLILLLHHEMMLDYLEIRVDFDEHHWRDVVLPKLVDFFHGCVLPELTQKRGQNALSEYAPWELEESMHPLYSDEILANYRPMRWNWPENQIDDDEEDA